MRIIGTTSMQKNWRKNFWNDEYLFAFSGIIGFLCGTEKAITIKGDVRIRHRLL